VRKGVVQALASFLVEDVWEATQADRSSTVLDSVNAKLLETFVVAMSVKAGQERHA